MATHRILHLTRAHQIHPDTQILLLGTFNPDTPGNTADFFYGRPRNYMWTLLPGAFGLPSLKKAGVADKRLFMEKHRVDFIDLIAEVEVEEPTNYDDNYLDSRVVKWSDVIGVINNLPHLQIICFTRRTFSGIPQMRRQVESIRANCHTRGIAFHMLSTPARFYTIQKAEEWKSVLHP
jgi:G:T/U-mismatch repair DNA glycosylase